MKKLIYSTEKVLNKVNSVMEVFTGYVIFAFMALLFFQVVMRFVFKHPIYGIDEAVTALMIWSMCLGFYYEQDAEMVPERNVHLHKYSGCRDQLGIHSGSMAAVPDAEEDASGRRTSVQQRLLLRTACSGNGCDHAGNVLIQSDSVFSYRR